MNNLAYMVQVIVEALNFALATIIVLAFIGMIGAAVGLLIVTWEGHDD